MKFDYILGNPPYQDDVQNKGDRANPVYDKFMEAAYEVGDVVELIHPARFLFNAGQTSKAWNEKMLNDEHLKVLVYDSDSSRFFPNVDIKGGIAVTIHDNRKVYGAIGVFTPYPELNSIIQKVAQICKNSPRLDSIIASQGLYRFTDVFFDEHPEAPGLMGTGTGSKIVSSIMEKLPTVFIDEPSGQGQYIRMMGRIKGKRQYKYILKKYIVPNDYIDAYNLFIPEANNSGTYGETLTPPTIGYPKDGATDTFLSAGIFSSEDEAKNLETYIKTKFFRALLGAKKVTQHCPPPVWNCVPLHDFSPSSDIDWSASIPEIDVQLYRTYGLDQSEIEFIETHVKEMN